MKILIISLLAASQIQVKAPDPVPLQWEACNEKTCITHKADKGVSDQPKDKESAKAQKKPCVEKGKATLQDIRDGRCCGKQIPGI